MVPGTTLYQALLLSLQLLLGTYPRSDDLLLLPLIPPFLKQEQHWLVRGSITNSIPPSRADRGNGLLSTALLRSAH